ncbi:MAG: polysaccharide biosynthesis protein [Candidatus Micrarchaeia archaeon]|jgi:FlaA1/EpsC-like NDP-sugar epimerase
MANFVKGKKVVVTGGTGSFGNHIVEWLAKMEPQSVTIYSRDENKQYHMRHKLSDNPLFKFEIGDVRDRERLIEVFRGKDIVFHAAALKHVPQCEDFPFEAVKTNIIGAKNVAEAAIECGVQRVVAVSTDKAVKPINTMGISKAMQEKIMLNANGRGKTIFSVVRYGNVAGSRGSVIPYFKQLIEKKQTLPITNSDMTRFWLTLDDAIGLVFYALDNANGGEIFVRKASSCNIMVLADAMGEHFGQKKGYPTKVVGIRAGEKIHEVLVSEEEMVRATEEDEYFVIHPHGTTGVPRLHKPWGEFTSGNAEQLSKKQLIALLERIKISD